MARLRVHNFTISLDGYGAGPNQRLEEPLGEGGRQLHEWIFQTRSGRAMLGQDDGESGLNDDLFRARKSGIGATIMGRNMFGPIRGAWPDESWRGWWGRILPSATMCLCSLTISELNLPWATARRSTSSMPHHERSLTWLCEQPTAKTSLSAGARPPSVPSSTLGSSTRCMSRLRPFCWAMVSDSLSIYESTSMAIRAPN